MGITFLIQHPDLGHKNWYSKCECDTSSKNSFFRLNYFWVKLLYSLINFLSYDFGVFQDLKNIEN